MEKLRNVLDRTLEALGSIVFIVMIIVVLYQVFMRTVMNNPNTITEELVRFCLIWLSMLASAYVVGKKGHLAVTILSDNLKGSSQKSLALIVQVLFLLFAAIVMVFGGWKAVGVTMGQISPSLGIPMGYVTLAVPVAGVLMFVYSLLNLLQRDRLVPSDSEEAMNNQVEV